MSEHSGGIGKWLAGIVATVMSAVAVFYMTEGIKKPPQDISGNWQGVLYQQLPNGTISPYSYDLNLTQNGNSMDGTARLQVPPPYGYGISMRIKGAFSAGVLNFDDGPVIANGAPSGWSWCQKSVRLTPNQSNSTLQGTWSANRCGSGQVNLSR